MGFYAIISLKCPDNLLFSIMNKKNNSSILNIGMSSLSILLIVLGLFFIYLGIKDVLKNNDTSSDNFITDNYDGKINTGITTTKSPEEKSKDGDKLTAQDKSLLNQKEMARTGRWIATNYEKGDIAYGEYIVKSGDTLWEIAEAVYGSGFEWTKILEKNKSSIGFLPNGEQALIIPGQVLVIE